MGTPSVLIQKSTGNIIKFADYPREDMQPISGLDPDLEWLVITTPYVQPDYDSRIYVLNQIDSITTTPHPQWTWLNQYQRTWQTVKRTAAEIETAIYNAENNANNQVFPYEKQLKILALGIGVLYRNVAGMTLTHKEVAIKNKCLAIATNIWKNHDTRTAKVAAVNAGEEPDIDADWAVTPTA